GEAHPPRSGQGLQPPGHRRQLLVARPLARHRRRPAADLDLGRVARGHHELPPRSTRQATPRSPAAPPPTSRTTHPVATAPPTLCYAAARPPVGGAQGGQVEGISEWFGTVLAGAGGLGTIAVAVLA